MSAYRLFNLPFSLVIFLVIWLCASNSSAAILNVKNRTDSINSTTKLPPTSVSILWLAPVTFKRAIENVYDFYQTAGAINIALERVQRVHNILNTTKFNIIHRDAGECNPSRALQQVLEIEEAAKLQNKTTGFDVIIGPGCSAAAIPVNYYAQTLNRPHIMWVARDPQLSDESIHPNIVRTVPSYALPVDCALSFLEQMDWTRTSFLYDSDEFLCGFVKTAVANTKSANPQRLNIVEQYTISNALSNKQLEFILTNIARNVRIITTCDRDLVDVVDDEDNDISTVTINPNSILTLRVMAIAAKLGLTAQNTFQWISLRSSVSIHPHYRPPHIVSLTKLRQFLSAPQNVSGNGTEYLLAAIQVSAEEIIRAYNSVIQLSWEIPRDLTNFKASAMHELLNSPWNVPEKKVTELIAKGYGKSSKTFGPSLADAVYLYAKAVQTAVAAGNDWRNAHEMYKNFVSTRFDDGFASTSTFSLTEGGERQVNQLIFGPSPGYEVIMNGNDDKWMNTFQYKGIMNCSSKMSASISNSSADKKLANGNFLQLNHPFAWYTSNGKPPPSVPLCGWTDELCRTSLWWYVAIGASVLLILLGIAFAFLHNKMRSLNEAALLNVDWYIASHELKRHVAKDLSGRSTNSLTRVFSLSQESSLPLSRSTGAIVDVSVASLDNSSVATTSIDATSLSATRNFPIVNDDHHADNFRCHYKYRNELVRLVACPNAPKIVVQLLATATDPDSVRRSLANVIRKNGKNIKSQFSWLEELRAMKNMQHENVQKFIGIRIQPTTDENGTKPHPGDSNLKTIKFVMFAGNTKGTLDSVLRNGGKSANLDWLFLLSFISDIAAGLNYLHNNNVLKRQNQTNLFMRFHGRLTTRCVELNSRWVAKITDHGMCTFGRDGHAERAAAVKQTKTDKELPLKDTISLLWAAPELLRSPEDFTLSGNQEKLSTFTLNDCLAQQHADVYSFSMVMFSILHQQAIPFNDYFTDLNNEEDDDHNSLRLVRFKSLLKSLERVGGNDGKKLFRPKITVVNNLENMTADKSEQTCIISTCRLLERCWAESALDRPTMNQVVKTIKSISSSNSSTNSIMETIVQKLEKYADNLEQIVQARTADLLDERQRSDSLLYRMLPPAVANRLKRGSPVDPEQYESATLFFSDVVQFTVLAARSTPLQVVQLLNDLYVYMDDVLSRYDVYKVETIGDGYMVVSGIPVRNGNQHAREICRMSLAMLENVWRVRAPQTNTTDNDSSEGATDSSIRLRCGINTGAVVAGVVGLQMPRYCLFGDTVNVASRMESHGAPMRVHLSEATKDFLVNHSNVIGDCPRATDDCNDGEFAFELRGQVEVKGKGYMNTYWLTAR